MPSSPDIRRHDGWPNKPTELTVSQHRFTVPVVRPLPRPVISAIFDPRVW